MQNKSFNGFSVLYGARKGTWGHLMGHIDLWAFQVLYSIVIKIYTLYFIILFSWTVLCIHVCRITDWMGHLGHIRHAGARRGTRRHAGAPRLRCPQVPSGALRCPCVPLRAPCDWYDPSNQLFCTHVYTKQFSWRGWWNKEYKSLLQYCTAPGKLINPCDLSGALRCPHVPSGAPACPMWHRKPF